MQAVARGGGGMQAAWGGGENEDWQWSVVLASLRRPRSPTLSSDRRSMVPVQSSSCIPAVPPPPRRHQPETAQGQIPRAPRSTRPGGSRSPQGPRGRISLRFDRYFPITSGFPPPWTLLLRQPGSRGSPTGVEGHGRLRRGFPSAARSPRASDPERPPPSSRDPAAARSWKQPPASAQLPSSLCRKKYTNISLGFRFVSFLPTVISYCKDFLISRILIIKIPTVYPWVTQVFVGLLWLYSCFILNSSRRHRPCSSIVWWNPTRNLTF